MQLKVATWNLEGRLSNRTTGKRGSPMHIVQNIIKLDADILFLPEACKTTGMAQGIQTHLERAGYEIFYQEYKENIKLGQINYGPLLVLLVKKSLQAIIRFDANSLRLGDIREALVAHMTFKNQEKLCFVGVHLHDKNEDLRLRMAADLIYFVQQSTESIIVTGDFNAMNGRLWRSRFLQSRFFETNIRVLPHPHIKSLLWRVHEMASGHTLAAIEHETNLLSVNKKNKATVTPKSIELAWMPRIKLIGIDHMYMSPQLKTSVFLVYPDGGSDHRAISARFSL